MAPDRNPPLPQIVSLSDEDLMARVAEDDERAFTELVGRFQGRVTNLVSRVLNDRNASDDLAQEVFVRVFVHRRNYRRGSKFSTWIFTIAANLAKNEIRTWFAGRAAPQFSGPVGIAQATGEVVDEAGWVMLLSFAALLSINLAILNILPLPMLDGGRMFFVFIEILRRGKRISPQREGLVHLVGFVAMLGLVVLLSFFDVQRIISGEQFFR